MSEDISRTMSDCAEIEALLSEYAAADMFGTPPAGLVRNAMASLDDPCAARRHSRLPVVVMCLAAAGILFASTSGLHQSAVRQSPDGSASDIPVLAVGEPAAPVFVPVPEFLDRGPQFELASAQTENQSTPLRGAARRRAAPPAPIALWSHSVVTTSEQGLVIPVSAQEEDAPADGSDGRGVQAAIMPIQSAVIYTDLPGNEAP